MGHRLLLDEDIQSYELLQALRDAGHDVFTVNESRLRGMPDTAVLVHAKAENRSLLTYNADDIRALRAAEPLHSGIIAVYRHGIRDKNMTPMNIIHALSNLESTRIKWLGPLGPIRFPQFLLLHLNLRTSKHSS